MQPAHRWGIAAFRLRPLAKVIDLLRVALVVGSGVNAAFSTEFVAQWNGGSGDWTTPSNWTITEGGLPHAPAVPNNSASDTFDVLIDQDGSAVNIPANIAIQIRKLTLNTRATAQATGGISGIGSLTVTGDSRWLNGYLTPFSLKLLGNVTVSTSGSNDTLGLGEVSLAGHTFVAGGATLRIGGNSMRNEAGATIEFDDGASLVSSIDFQNFGTFRVLPGRTTFDAGPFVTIANSGTIELPAKPVKVAGGIRQNGGSIHLDSTHFEAAQGQVQLQGGTLGGRGEIVANSVSVSAGATVKGSFDCSQSLGVQFEHGSTLELELRDVNDYDTFKASFLQLHASLKVDVSTQPTFGFEIVEAGQVDGEFENVAVGQRVQISNDPGSYLLSRVDGPPVRFSLSTYSTDPVQLQFSQLPLVYSLRPASAFGLDTNATLTAVNSLNWDGAKLEVKITQGLDRTNDQIILGPPPGYRFGVDSILVGDSLATGTQIAALTNFKDDVTIVFNSNAAAQNVQDLLRSFYYYNSDFRPESFEQWDDKEADRKIDITLTAHAGTNVIQRQATATIVFPFLTGISFDLPFFPCQGASATLNIIGAFSDQTTAPVPFLETTFTSSDPGLIVTRTVNSHGTASLLLNTSGTITAIAGPFSASATILVQECGNGSLVIGGCVPAFIAFVFGYVGSLHVNLVPQMPPPSPNPPLPFVKAEATRPGVLTPAFSLELYRSIRALLNQTAQGQQLVQLYEKHSLEVVRILSTHRQLLTNVYEIFVNFSPGLNALLQGQGNTVQMTPTMISDLSVAWTQIENLGSAELRKDMEDQRGRFQGFLAFAGKDFNAWASLLHVPAPSQPFLYVSRTGLDKGAFFLKANDLPGLELSLWKSATITSPAWVRVEGSRIARDGFSATILDTNPPPARVFYQVRAQPAQ